MHVKTFFENYRLNIYIVWKRNKQRKTTCFCHQKEIVAFLMDDPI